MGITLAVSSTEGKTLEEKEILNISDSWLEMLFLSNFSILVGMLLGPTDLLESWNYNTNYIIRSYYSSMLESNERDLLMWRFTVNG